MAEVESLFVYGSWCEGGEQHDLLRPYVEKLQDCYVLGQAYRTSVGYPVLVMGGGDRVSGQLITLNASEFLWKLLEDLHGLSPTNTSLFKRITQEVWAPDGTSLGVAKMFAVESERVDYRWNPIANGDWRTELASAPPLVQRMTERQKNYVRRLGRSTGREIIPIDLELYRELMKLQLIVDKGRRLALTSLGWELLRYLSPS